MKTLIRFPKPKIDYLVDATGFSRSKVIALLYGGYSSIQVIAKSNEEEVLDNDEWND